MFPEVAQREVRSLHLKYDNDSGGIPAGEYFFVESYCTNPDCDCERVTIDVAERGLGIVASISYDLDPAAPTYPGRPNPCLDPSSRQGPYAERVLGLFKDVALNEEYNERLKRHYRLVKSAMRSLSGGVAGGEPSRRGSGAKQQRKQQKAAQREIGAGDRRTASLCRFPMTFASSGPEVRFAHLTTRLSRIAPG